MISWFLTKLVPELELWRLDGKWRGVNWTPPIAACGHEKPFPMTSQSHPRPNCSCLSFCLLWRCRRMLWGRTDIVPNTPLSGISSEPKVCTKYFLAWVLWTNFALGQLSINHTVIFVLDCLWAPRSQWDLFSKLLCTENHRLLRLWLVKAYRWGPKHKMLK